MTYIIEIHFYDRPPVVYKRVKNCIRDAANNWLHINYVDHSTDTYVYLSDNVLSHSKFKDTEYEKETTTMSMPKRLARRV